MLIHDDAFASPADILPRPRLSSCRPDGPGAGPSALEASDLSAILGRGALLRLALKLAREHRRDANGPCLETPLPGETRTAAAALGLIADPAALIEPNGEIVAANAAFLARATHLRPIFVAQFFAARTARAERGQGAGAPEMRFHATGGGVLILFALREGGNDDGALAVMRAPQANERCCDHGLLEQAFALTPAEARLACALMRTKSLPAAIRELGLKDKTGRTYLDRIFQKTGAKSQLQLYAILMELYLMATPGA